MKKITAILVACAFGACAYSKSLDELTAEYQSLSGDDSQALWRAQKDFVRENSADLKTAFESWKNADVAKFAWQESEFKELAKSLSAEDIKKVDAQKQIFMHLYQQEKGALSAPDRVLMLLSTRTFCEVKAVDNPSYYSEIKAAGWVVGGVKLPPTNRALLACFNSDAEYLMSMTQSELASMDNWAWVECIKNLTPVLLDMEDPAAAKSICNKIENAAVLKGLSGEAKSKLEALGKVLSTRVLESKILK